MKTLPVFRLKYLYRSLVAVGLFLALASADTGCTNTLFVADFKWFTPGSADSYPIPDCQGAIDLSRMQEETTQLQVEPSGELTYRAAASVANRYLGFVAKPARFDQRVSVQWLVTPVIGNSGSNLLMWLGDANQIPLAGIEFSRNRRLRVVAAWVNSARGYDEVATYGNGTSYQINLEADPATSRYRLKVTNPATERVLYEQERPMLNAPRDLRAPNRLALWMHYPDDRRSSSCRIKHVIINRKNPEPTYPCTDRRSDWYPREFAFDSFEYLGRDGQVVASLSATNCEVPLDPARAKRVEPINVNGMMLNTLVYDVRIRVRRAALDPACGRGTYRLRTITRSNTVTSNTLSDVGDSDPITDLSWLPTTVGAMSERTFEVRFRPNGSDGYFSFREYYLCNQSTVDALKARPSLCLYMRDFCEAHQRVKPAGESGTCAGLP